MAKRRSNIASRLSRMKGIDSGERDLLISIGELLDKAINSTSPGNPYEPSRAMQSRYLKPPTNVLIETGIKTVKLVWDAIDSSRLLRYELMITNLDTGVTTTETTFTNSFIFKGKSGSYRAFIKAVGRDGNSSPIKDVQFGIGPDVMFIEGAKNGVETLGTLVHDDITLLKDYKIFAWGSCVLDKFAAGSANNELVFELYKGPKGSTINEATLVEQITMYKTSTTATNYDDAALGGLISRPTANRTATFECSQAVMFSPISIDDADDGTTKTFFLKAINRETEDDIVGLSLVLWAGSEGISSKVPGDPFTPEPDIVFPWYQCLHLLEPTTIFSGVAAEDSNWLHGEIAQNVKVLANQWTIAIWVRPLGLDFAGGSSSSLPGTIIDRAGTGSGNIYYNRFLVDATAGEPGPGLHSHILTVTLGDFNGNNTAYVINAQISTISGRHHSNIWPNAEFNDITHLNGGWHLQTFVFSGSPSASTSVLDLYTNGILQVNGVANNPSYNAPTVIQAKGIVQDTTKAQAWCLGVNWNAISTAGLYQGPNTDPGQDNVFGAMYYAIGAWNVALGASEIAYLYNQGKGYEINWLENGTSISGTYLSANNLVHYWQLGAVDSAVKYLARDTGIHPYGGDISLTTTITNADVTDANSYDDRFGFDYEYQSGTVGNVRTQYPGKVLALP